MGRFVKGDVVVIPFPFSDLVQSKRRPALVVSPLYGDDMILCQITSQAVTDIFSINLCEDDFEVGSLKKDSNIRPNKIFTVEKSIVCYKVGTLQADKLQSVIQKITEIIINY